jgi:hypothetical protein
MMVRNDPQADRPATAPQDGHLLLLGRQAAAGHGYDYRIVAAENDVHHQDFG